MVIDVFAIAVARGVTNSFNQPARQSLISDLVPATDLPNAVALNSATLNLTRVIGPALGGILIATVGVAGCFYLNAFSFLAVLGILRSRQFSILNFLWMTIPPSVPSGLASDYMRRRPLRHCEFL